MGQHRSRSRERFFLHPLTGTRTVPHGMLWTVRNVPNDFNDSPWRSMMVQQPSIKNARNDTIINNTPDWCCERFQFSLSMLSQPYFLTFIPRDFGFHLQKRWNNSCLHIVLEELFPDSHLKSRFLFSCVRYVERAHCNLTAHISRVRIEIPSAQIKRISQSRKRQLCRHPKAARLCEHDKSWNI